MRALHQYWKVFVVGFLMAVMFAVGNAARFWHHGASLRAFRARFTQRLSRVALVVLGVELTVEGAENWRPGRNYLLVSNHLSYLDALVYSAFQPLCFVTSVEVKETKGLGWLAAAAGCIFIERRSREKLTEEIDVVANALRDGASVIFFPEGTSTNGSGVLPFKRPFFAPALRASVPVLPCVVQFRELNGQPVTAANRDRLCWYGDMDFAPHLLGLAGSSGVRVTLKVLPEIPVKAGTEREELVQAAQSVIHSTYQPIL